MGLFDEKHGLTPEQVSKLARQTVSQDDIIQMVKSALREAIGDAETMPSPQARKFIQDIMFPKDASQFEDVKWKRVVFCSFSEYNEIQKLKKEVEQLRTENARLEEKLTEYDPDMLDTRDIELDHE